MIEISQEALTELVGYAVTLYIWMEAFIKPVMRVGAQRIRQQFVKEPVGDQAKSEQDELYTARLHSSFRVVPILIGIVFVWGNNVGTNQDLLNWITAGAAIGLGSRGTHFLVDVAEGVMRFTLARLSPNEPPTML